MRTIIVIGVSLLLGFSSLLFAQDWSVSVPIPTCETALGTPINCLNSLAVTLVFLYTIADSQNGVHKIGVLRVPKSSTPESILNALQYLGNQERYKQETTPNPTQGVTIPIK